MRGVTTILIKNAFVGMAVSMLLRLSALVAQELQGGHENGKYHTRVHLVLYAPKEKVRTIEELGALMPPSFLTGSERRWVRKGENVNRLNPLDHIYPQFKEQLADLGSADPTPVEESLTRMDGRFLYHVALTVGGQQDIGVLIAPYAQTKPIMLDPDNPSRMVIYRLFLGFNVRRFTDDGFALVDLRQTVVEGDSYSTSSFHTPLEIQRGVPAILSGNSPRVDSRNTEGGAVTERNPGTVFVLTVW